MAATWALVAYFAAVQFVNYYETARRHPSIGNPRLSWSQLRETYDEVARGNFAAVAAKHPFQSQLFSYGFEQAATLEHAAGRWVGLLPTKDLDSSLIHFIPFTTIMDPGVPGLKKFEVTEGSLSRESKAERGSALALAGQIIRGSLGEWQFIRHLTRNGEIRERAWRQGLMRVWSRRGSAMVTPEGLCLMFPGAAQQCIARVYKSSGFDFTFSDDGTPVMTFMRLFDDSWLPLDLRG
jgi:hypothetical protein